MGGRRYLALGIATQQRSTVESVVHHRHLNLVEMSDLARKNKIREHCYKETLAVSGSCFSFVGVL